MTNLDFRPAEQLKFELLAPGITIDNGALAHPGGQR